MKERVASTKFPYFRDVELFKVGTKAELNRLWKEKKIVIHDGIHGRIIEYIL